MEHQEKSQKVYFNKLNRYEITSKEKVIKLLNKLYDMQAEAEYLLQEAYGVEEMQYRSGYLAAVNEIIEHLENPESEGE